ncbi:MAG: PstS family phosphate ABC transporter substrate-binding protein [Nitrosomonas sp.]|nr:PstS family phosphate ABC transporter substrate-binding protein [Nitrosomonas sp.]
MLQLCKSKLLSMIVLLGALTSFSSTATAQSIIKIDGSSTVYPISKVAADWFQVEKNNTVKVNVDISRSGGGFRKFCRGEIDIVNASRPILKNEIADCKKSHVQYVEIPIAYDALTVAVNPKNYWITTLTVAELKKIWEPTAQGKITKWNQINPAWPDEAFKLYGANENSGTYDYFTRAVVGKVKSSRSDFTQSANDNILVESVAGDKNALGFFGFAYYIENQSIVKAIAINSGLGDILPSVESVENGSYQPFSRPIFIYVNIEAAEKPEVKEFVEFYIKNAILLVKEAKFFPLPPSAYRTMMGHFNKRRVGTVFNGLSAVGLTIDDLIRREERTEFEHR